MRIADLYADKAMFFPGETVKGSLLVQADKAASGLLSVTAYHLEQPLGQALSIPFRAEAGETVLAFEWQPPANDFQGYLLKVSLLDETGSILDTREVAADVSSTWTKFPRYGYVWDFTEGTSTQEKIAALNKYHINGLQYYDWQYRHHIPLPEDTSRWQDWSGRWIYGDVVRGYIAAAREHGMASLAYNMVYAANLTYLKDGTGVDPAWRLQKSTGEEFTCIMSENRGSTGILQFFNILNESWQNYIFPREIEAIDAMGFDGWHGDTIGESGRMQTADGKALGVDDNGHEIHYVKDGFTIFLNRAKEALGNRYLVFNPVGAQGIEKVNESRVDVLYAEIWPWDKNRWGQHYDTYNALQREIEAAQAESGGKSLVMAAYVNYKAPDEHFNPATVLLMDAVVFASGGARIELGNGDNMLSSEYFPSDVKKTMEEGLQADVRRMYDFITAYENLLRDGQRPVQRKVVLNGCKQTTTGAGNAVWTFVRADETHEVLHLINLSGTDNLWRDDTQEKAAPEPKECISIRYYTEKQVTKVCLASPDGDDLRAQELPYVSVADASERYIEFTVPSLLYWDMVFMR